MVQAIEHSIVMSAMSENLVPVESGAALGGRRKSAVKAWSDGRDVGDVDQRLTLFGVSRSIALWATRAQSLVVVRHFVLESGGLARPWGARLTGAPSAA
jgi:hypothetical protein